ncbi:Hypothetical Protein FCC1311_048322 [Hondaea fermentalgiana]|uniref:Uncharacterized protein n=1 Tax=Hondaea fermentalgiana TaxID=2315210 RepID=A0A2R5GK04_9STRA|nr:Hypothetical Protein FCC1311_048322 [Hondaea fermentalgiana]|eukprot:GBG28611.1 Hypothetical Protein FCC1311_048322 [Hondaea fermentalgiana]
MSLLPGAWGAAVAREGRFERFKNVDFPLFASDVGATFSISTSHTRLDYVQISDLRYAVDEAHFSADNVATGLLFFVDDIVQRDRMVSVIEKALRFFWRNDVRHMVVDRRGRIETLIAWRSRDEQSTGHFATAELNALLKVKKMDSEYRGPLPFGAYPGTSPAQSLPGLSCGSRRIEAAVSRLTSFRGPPTRAEQFDVREVSLEELPDALRGIADEFLRERRRRSDAARGLMPSVPEREERRIVACDTSEAPRAVLNWLLSRAAVEAHVDMVRSWDWRDSGRVGYVDAWPGPIRAAQGRARAYVQVDPVTVDLLSLVRAMMNDPKIEVVVLLHDVGADFVPHRYRRVPSAEASQQVSLLHSMMVGGAFHKPLVLASTSGALLFHMAFAGALVAEDRASADALVRRLLAAIDARGNVNDAICCLEKMTLASKDEKESVAS